MMVGKGIEDIDMAMPRDAYNTGKDTPTFNAYLTVIVRSPEGRVVKVHRQRSHSPTSNFIALILPLTFFSNGGSAPTLKNTSGNTSGYGPALNSNAQCITYPASSTNRNTNLVMIQVGSGQQSNPYSAYNLAAPITNGSGSGQLIYGAPSVSSTPIVSGSSVYFYISQAFNNVSGGTVVITEVGILIYISTYSASAGAVQYVGDVLVWYDVLSSAISVPSGGSVTIYYTFAVNP